MNEILNHYELKSPLYEQIEKMAASGSWLMEAGTDEITFSNNYYRIHGLEPATANNGFHFFASFIEPADIERLLEVVQQALLGTTPDVEYQIITAAGDVKLIRQQVSVVRSGKDTPYIVGVIKDISWRVSPDYTLGHGRKAATEVTDPAPDVKLAMAHANEQAHFISKVADATPDIILTMNVASREVKYINRVLPEVLGYPQMQSMSFFDLVHEDDKPSLELHLQELAQAKDDDILAIEYRVVDAEGSTRWMSERVAVFRRDMNGRVIEKIGVLRDTTRRKQQESDLQKSFNILKQTETIMPLGSWEYDLTTNVFNWSNGMYNLFEIDRNTAITPDIYHDYAVEEDKAVAEKIVSAIKHKPAQIDDYIRLSVNGRVKILQVSSTVVQQPDGPDTKVIGVDLDVTERVKKEQEMQAMNKTLLWKNKELKALNAELNTFTYVAGHDLKEPLRKVYTFLDLIQSREAPQLTDIGKSYFKRAQASVQRMNLLTDDILAFAQLENKAERRSEVDLWHVVKFVVHSFRNQIENIGATVTYDELPKIRGYRQLVSVLMQHLIDNALKFRREGAAPELRITASMVHGKDLPHADADKTGEYACISFIDNGIGIDKQYTEKIFQMFQRLHSREKYKGSGIGLAICRKVMDKHHGFITMDSKKGEGAVFSCYFPKNTK